MIETLFAILLEGSSPPMCELHTVPACTPVHQLAFARTKAPPVLSDIGKRQPFGSCRLATPEQCARSGEWITDDPKFKSEVISFFRSIPKGKFGYYNEDTWELFMHTIYGPHLDPDLIAPGIYLFSACLTRHCSGRQVAVVVGRGKILAAAMAGDLCDRCDRTIYVFLKRSEPSSQRWLKALARWGTTEGYGPQPNVVFLP